MSQADTISQASNYFEGIKIRVSLAWDDMKNRIKSDQRAKLQATHDKIQKLKLLNWAKSEDLQHKVNQRIQNSIERIVAGSGSEEDFEIARYALDM